MVRDDRGPARYDDADAYGDAYADDRSDGYDDGYDDEYDGYGDEYEDEPPRRGSPSGRRRSASTTRRNAQNGRKPKRGKAAARTAAVRGQAASDAPRRGHRGVRAGGGVGPVSKFSASALRRVTVLGDRPSQVVYTLAEQSRRKRGTAVLGTLVALCCTALIALLGVLGYQLTLGPNALTGKGNAAIVDPPEGHSTLLPELYQGHQEDETEVFAPIAQRPDDAAPLTEKEVFGPAEKLELDDFELLLKDSEATDTCTALVWGEELAQSLADGSCTSAARGVYQDKKEKYVAQFTLFDLADTEAAQASAQALDPTDHTTESGFVLPLDESITGLHEGYSQATAQVMGHYLAVYWVARADGGQPAEDETMAALNVVAMDASVWVYQEVGEAKQQAE